MTKYVSREVLETLEQYQQLLFKWNTGFNLISRHNKENFWKDHILDCILLLKYIENYDLSVIDVGSGNGLPGIVMSICGIKNVTLVESSKKKCAFLLQAAKLSNNKINIINDRIENVTSICDILVAKGFANLNKLFSCSKNVLIKEKYILLKGNKHDTEILEAQNYWKFSYKIYDSVSSKNKILEISNLCQKK